MNIFELHEQHLDQCNALHSKIARIKSGRSGHTSYPRHIIIDAIRLYDQSNKNEKDFSRSVGLNPRTFCTWLHKRRHYLGIPSYPDFGEFSAPSEGFFERRRRQDQELQATTIGEYLEQDMAS